MAETSRVLSVPLYEKVIDFLQCSIHLRFNRNAPASVMRRL
ncbi:MAG: hypothetical protein AAF250_12970 [Pseudomonadota bacterium]